MDVFDVFVDTLVSSFSIRVGIWDTVLMIKHKIEMSQGVPVSKQILFFQDKILQDHLHIIQCNILQNSRLLLYISPHDIPNHNNDQVIHQNNDQVLYQTTHSPAPSYSTQQIIHGRHQHWPVRSNYSQELQTEQPPAPSNQLDELLNSQGWSMLMGSNEDQVLQTEKTQVSLDSIDEFLGIQDSSPVASDSVGAIINGQDSSVMVRGNYNESRSFSEIDELIGIQPVTAGSNSNTNQVVRPLASSSVKEIINIPDSPVKKKMKIGAMKITVMVMPFKENRKIPVEVNANDNVKELRKELVNMQKRGQINLPKERYFFIHKQDVLEDDWSFRRNHVAHGDTIEIFRGYVVKKGSTTTSVRSFGH